MNPEIDYMLQNGIAEHASSLWSSPRLLFSKADRPIRFCTDYRKVNSLTKSDCYPLPRMEDCTDQFRKAVFVTKLDLLKGYWQVLLTPRAWEVSAFVTPDGLF